MLKLKTPAPTPARKRSQTTSTKRARRSAAHQNRAIQSAIPRAHVLREKACTFDGTDCFIEKMRRPSLTRSMVDSLEEAIVELRAALAREEDGARAAKLLNSVNYLRGAIDYKKATDPKFKDAGASEH